MTEVLTALGHRWEGSVATTLEQVRGVAIARRCADVPELLSVAEAGLGTVAVVSADLRGLDLEVVQRLRALSVHVVGVHARDDEVAERRLRQLAVHRTVAVEAGADGFARAIADDPTDGDELERVWAESAAPSVPEPPPAPTTGGRPGRGDDRPADTGATARGTVEGWRPAGSPPHPGAEGRVRAGVAAEAPSAGDCEPEAPATVVAVWGPAGAPGRTTVATTLAAELASRGVPVLLVDADTYGGSVAQALGLLDEAPGLAAACRAAEHGTLDLPALSRTAPEVVRHLRVLTGLPKAERWPEVRSAAFERVLDLARSLVRVVVVDCAFCLEDDEELSYDTIAPRRNEATLTALAAADTVVAVGGADPVGLQRLVRGLQELATVPSGRAVPVVNRVRSTAVGARPETRIADSLLRFAGLDAVHFVPDEPAVVDGAVLAGRSVVEHAPESRVRSAVAQLTTILVPWSSAAPDSRRRRLLAGRAPARHGVVRA